MPDEKRTLRIRLELMDPEGAGRHFVLGDVPVSEALFLAAMNREIGSASQFLDRYVAEKESNG